MGTKQYDNYADLITFTRASSATYLDSDGILKTASNNIPRIDYDANGNRKGLLIEEARTNLLTYSEDFFNAAWIVSVSGTGSVTKSTDNAATAPDGTLTADRVIFDLVGGTTTGDLALLRQANATTGNLTHSVYLRSFDGVSSYTMQIIQPDGNGSNITVTGSWQRFDVSGTSVGNVNYGIRLRGGQSPANSDYADVLIWGAQLEAGSFPTSYIPTSGTQVTRSADVASIPVSAFGYNQKAGTVVVEARSLNVAGNGVIAAITDGTANEQSRIQAGAGNQFVVVSGGVTQAAISGGTFPTGDFAIVSSAYKDNDFAVCLDGGTVATDTSGSVPSANKVTLGINSTSNGTFLNGHIKSIQYYPRRLTNTQLQELTS